MPDGIYSILRFTISDDDCDISDYVFRFIYINRLKNYRIRVIGDDRIVFLFKDKVDFPISTEYLLNRLQEFNQVYNFEDERLVFGTPVSGTVIC